MKPDKNIATIQVFLKDTVHDLQGERIKKKFLSFFGISTGVVRTGKQYVVQYPLTPQQLEMLALEGVSDKVINTVHINQSVLQSPFASYLVIEKLPGVTDDEGISAQKTLQDIFSLEIDTNTQHIFSQDVYCFENDIPEQKLREAAASVLCNPLINHITTGTYTGGLKLYIPEVHLEVDTTIETIDCNREDAELDKLSQERLLALNTEEMRTVKEYFNDSAIISGRAALGMPGSPTDCELEIIAQTWSEHCKHKEFNAVIQYSDSVSGEEFRIDSLFKTYIKGATAEAEKKLRARDKNWLVKVFSDNAGIVKVNAENYFVWKVETHNSPSAIDPYGGAITGILGNNRDPLCTGVGGAKLLFNTNVLCFGPPSYSRPLLRGQLHPARIFEGVRKGIEDGGNKSGIPTVNGSIIFDDRYSGKPLVYCGTGGILPRTFNGKATWDKEIFPGDAIISVGGRVGKDGIHGATFSSREIDEHSPQSAVQIGSPIVQKMASDFLEAAARRGLVRTSTDCGAGGLSSAIGELASFSNGAVVHLENVPLKYSGLKPWEIFLSESQERLILAVGPEHVEEVLQLAGLFETEASVIGCFTNDGNLVVKYEQQTAACLNLDFLHNGVPRKYLDAEWMPIPVAEAADPVITDYASLLKKLLASDAISSREAVIRQYDHEVKGKTIIKPLMGKKRGAPQDAAVVRIDHDTFEGIAVSNGILPKYADIDPYQSSAGAFDEAIRQIIAVGGTLPLTDMNEDIFWSVNDNFCVPDSVYHPENNPDGKRKLAQLVQMCKALYDMSTFYAIPMTSGKDSMKNDFRADGVKISVPPTLLYSAAAKIPDVRKTVTSDFKNSGDLIYQLGITYAEPGESEFYKILGIYDTRVPKVRVEEAAELFAKMHIGHAGRLFNSVHDVSDGGMIVSVIECCFGAMTGAELKLAEAGGLTLDMQLFSESPSRFVVTVSPDKKQEFEALFERFALELGSVTENSMLQVMHGEKEIMSGYVEDFYDSWKNGLSRQMI